MKIQLERDSEFIEVKRLVIIIDGKEYRLKENNGLLNINKFHQEESKIKILPSMSNDVDID